eukprot:SAG11_NODE_5003_length_1695_cov_1.113409_1_plen_421_part_00
MCDLLIQADTLYDADGNAIITDGPCAVAITDDRIVASGRLATDVPANLAKNPKRLIRLSGDVMLAPGLIDLHCHVDPSAKVSRYGLDPDVHYLPRGVTTVLSQGDAGAQTWAAYSAAVANCETRCLMAMNILNAGELPSYFEGREDGEDLEDFDSEACEAAMCAPGGAAVWGVDINTGHNHGSVAQMREAMRRAVTVAEATGTPILFGMRRQADQPFGEQLEQLRAGDVVTYVFRSTPHNIIRPQDGRLAPAIAAAARRGVLFDIGHGGNAFDFTVAEASLAQGLAPDTISTDLHSQVPWGDIVEDAGASCGFRVGSDRGRHELLRVMAKLESVGMGRLAVLKAVTATPARVLGLGGEIGTLRPGSCADVVGLRWRPAVGEERWLEDAFGNRREVAGWYQPACVVRAGRLVVGGEAAASL